ncbi:MAG TPA: hypothetical protein VMU19_12755 [Bryobacteraceae bacterium]|nr:hypothetical protein [Bryobacteraceae bacterium]
MFHLFKLWKSLGVCVCGMAMAGVAAHASLIANGSFENYTGSVANAGDNAIDLAGAGLLNWSDASGVAEALVFPSWYGNYLFNIPGPIGPVGLAGPLPATSPDGGNFIISDSDYLTSAIFQTINGLTPGASYQLSFYQALAQDSQPVTQPGAVSAYWQVALGAGTQTSTQMYADGSIPTVSNWQAQTMTFVASSASEVLSFLAVGTGVPPMAALDGVSLTETPEPAAFWMLGAGGLLLARRLMVLRRR